MNVNRIVELLNPWTGEYTGKFFDWNGIVGWCEQNVADCAKAEWLNEAKEAYLENDGRQLGIMIIGS